MWCTVTSPGARVEVERGVLRLPTYVPVRNQPTNPHRQRAQLVGELRTHGAGASGTRGPRRLDVARHRHAGRPPGRERASERRRQAGRRAEEPEAERARTPQPLSAEETRAAERSCCWAASELMRPPRLLLPAEGERATEAKSSAGSASPAAMRLASSVGAAARRLRLSCGLPRSRRRSLCAFAVPGLRQPEDCARLAHEAAQACEGLVARVVAGASSPTLDVLYGLDEMSETLCRVLDTMELCRNVHPDPAWAEAANSAYVQLAGHMQMLNTEPRLYEAVDALLQEPRLRTSLTAEQLRFAQSMAAEFQHDGVHLSAERRQQLCALHAEAEELALRFGSGAGGGESLHVLQQLLERRQQIAAALGHSSWATYACAHGRMEADPSAVRGALVRLLEGLRPLAAAEQRELSSETALGGGAGQTRAAEAAEAEAALRPYLELQSCLDGLEGVLQQAFGLRLVRAAAAEGELWDPTVRKLLLVRGAAPAGGSAGGGGAVGGEAVGGEAVGGEAVGGEAVGVLYLDLFAREGKSGQAALYTLRAAASRPPPRVAAAIAAAAAAAAAARRPTAAVAASAVLQRTLPAAALVCDLPRAGAEGSDARTGRATLSAAQLQTLYHEVGHALHALLSRTEFQHLAGVVRHATEGLNPG